MKLEVAEDVLSREPRPQQAKQLRGDRTGWRLRVGDYRILYSIEGDLVSVHDAGHRKDVYED